MPCWLWIEVHHQTIGIYCHSPHSIGGNDYSADCMLRAAREAVQRAVDWRTMMQLWERMKDSFSCPVFPRVLFFSEEAYRKPTIKGTAPKANSRLERLNAAMLSKGTPKEEKAERYEVPLLYEGEYPIYSHFKKDSIVKSLVCDQKLINFRVENLNNCCLFFHNNRAYLVHFI